jgi:poly(3-hydroxybutyrate) depolymerase
MSMDRLLYSAYHGNRALAAPARLGSAAALKLLETVPAGMRDSGVARHLAALSSLLVGTQLTHTRPDFGDPSSPLLGADGAPTDEVVVDSTPFASLLHFKQRTERDLPKVLIAAPLSGHFATMLTPTVRTMLSEHDVYITDWHNARDVPVEAGHFGLDEYVDHIVRFLRKLGPDTHLFAVCQPCVPAVMATAYLAEHDEDAQPLSLTLMAGPIDTRANPTWMNRVAYRQPLRWYRRSITSVPACYPGAGRAVYPGFLQVSSFMSLNLRRHWSSQAEIYRSIAKGEIDASRRTRDFYAEYFAVLDMAAEFYLDTIERIFQQDLLPKGAMSYHGTPVRPELIKRIAVLTIEAERDDMCAPGQTVAAHELFSGIDGGMHEHHLAPGVGHYGVFAGKRWTNDVYPVVARFIRRTGQVLT